MAAYYAAHIVARRPISSYRLRRSAVVARIAYERIGEPGDDIQLIAADGVVYEVQAKHGLSADVKLGDTIVRLADLPDAHFGLLVVDRGTSSRTVTNDLADVFEHWRNGVSCELSDPLCKHLAPLLVAGAENVRTRIAVVPIDLDDDHNDGVLYAVEILRSQLVDRDRAENAWSSLVKHAGHSSKRGYSLDRARIVDLLNQEGLEVIAEDRVLVAVSSPLPESPLAAVSTDISAELRVIASLVDGLQPTAALTALDALAEPASNMQRAQRLTLRGVALLQLEQFIRARSLLQEALGYASEYLPAILNLAIVETILNNDDETRRLVQSATVLAPSNPDVWAAQLRIAPNLSLRDVPAEIREHRAVLAAAGASALERGEYSDAVATLRAAMADGDFDPHCASTLAAALELAAERLASPEKEKLREEALRMLDRVLETVRDGDAGMRRSAIWNRAIVLEGLGQPERALEAFRELVAAGAPTRELAARYAQRALASGRDLADALRAVEQILITQRDFILAALRAALLRATGQLDAARSELRVIAAEAADANLDVEECVAIAGIAIDLGDPETAEAALGRVANGVRDVRVSVLCGRAYSLAGRVDEADAAYAAALETVDAGYDRPVRLEYAGFLRTQKRFSRAVDILLSVADSDDEHVMRTLVEVCYAAREFSKAEQFAARAGDGVWWAARTLAFIALQRQDFARAEQHFSRWLALDGAAHEPVFRLIELWLLAGNRARACSALAKIELTSLEPDDQLRLATLWLQAEEYERALAAAFWPLRRNPENVDVVSRFFQIAALAGPRVASVEPTEATIDVAVTLRTKAGQEWVYLLTPDSHPCLALDELTTTNKLAAQLMGKHVGDQVVLRDSPQELATVIRLASRNAHAFRFAAEQLERQDPTSNALRSVRVVDDGGAFDTAAVEEILRSGAEREKRLLDQVQSEAMPLGIVACALGGSMLEAYAKFANDETRILPVEYPDPHPAIAAAGRRRFVVTRTVLATLDVLGARCLLEAAATELLVAPALVEELLVERREHLEVARFGRTAFGLSNSGLTLFETAPDVGAARLASHDELLTWIKANCAIVLPDSSLLPEEAWSRLTLGCSSHRDAFSRRFFSGLGVMSMTFART